MVVEQFQKCHIVLAASGVCFNSTGPSLCSDTVDLGRSIIATIITLLARTQGGALGATAAGPSSPKAGGLSVILNYHLVLTFLRVPGFAYLFRGGVAGWWCQWQLASNLSCSYFFIPNAGLVGTSHHSQLPPGLECPGCLFSPSRPLETVPSGID